MTPAAFGPFPLTDVGKLPNVVRVHPGEHWSDIRALGLVEPGAAIFPAATPANDAETGTPAGLPGVYTPGTRRWFKQVAVGDTPDQRQVAIALRPVEPPYADIYPELWGPNEIVNQDILDTQYVHAWFSGVFLTTLVVPDAGGYEGGEIIGWDPAGVRPVSKRGPQADRTGAWTHASGAGVVAGTDIFEVVEFDEHNATTHECSLELRSLRTQHI